MSLLAPALLAWLLLLPFMLALILAGRRRRTVRVGSVLLFRSLQGGEASRLKKFRSLSLLQAGLLSVFVICGVLHAAGLRLGGATEVVTWHLYIDDSVRMRATTPAGQTLAARAVEPARLWARRSPAGSRVVVHRLSATTSENSEAMEARRLGFMDPAECEDFLFAPDSFQTLSRAPAPANFRRSVYIGTSPEHGRRVAHSILVGGVDNVAVTVFEAKPAGDDGKLEYYAVIDNLSGAPQSVRWTLSGGDTRSAIDSGVVSLAGEMETELSGTCNAPDGSLVFSVAADSDGFALDDTATLLPLPTPVAAVRHDPAETATAQLLRKAVTACGWSAVDAEGRDGEAAVVYFGAGGGPAEGKPSFLVLPTDIEGMRGGEESVTGRLTYAPNVEIRWRRLQLDNINAVEVKKVSLPEKWRPILLAQDGSPALVGDGVNVLVLFDPARSGWAAQASFPLAVAEFLNAANAARGWQPARYGTETRIDPAGNGSLLSRKHSKFVSESESGLPEVDQEARVSTEGRPVELLLWLSLAGILLNYGVFAGRGATASRERRM